MATIDLEMTRIEGHMDVETTINNGRVVDARIKGKMFRGLENLLAGRHPVDALRITQRVCGVCHEVHGIASSLALEELYGVNPPRNGRILRDMILALHLATDHLLHFYTLSLPDFVDFAPILKYGGKDPEINKLKDWVASRGPGFISGRAKGDYISSTSICLPMITNYIKTLAIRARGGKGLAILGAKAPFAHALMPGGITTSITPDRLMNFRSVVNEVHQFVTTAYLPDVMTLASHFKKYFSIGVSHNNFYANESFSALGSPLIRSGVILQGSREEFQPQFVREEMTSSYYNPDFSPNPRKADGYSWSKSPRYKGQPLEVGPLARMMINRDELFQSMLKQLGGSEGSSVMGRIVARAAETQLICEHIYKLLDSYELDAPTITDIDFSRPVTGSGSGYSFAARGALIHNVQAKDGRIAKYNMIVPSTWNFGPRTETGLGVTEQALVGTPVEYGETDSVEVGRVVRSYDPCTACAIH
jgi:hydrogenase large subunit